LRSVRKEGIRRLTLLYRTFHRRYFTDFDALVHSDVVAPLLVNLVDESLQAPSPLLTLLHEWSELPLLAELFNAHSPQLLPSVFMLLKHSAVKPSVVRMVLTMADNLLPSQEDVLRRTRLQAKQDRQANAMDDTEDNSDNDGNDSDAEMTEADRMVAHVSHASAVLDDAQAHDVDLKEAAVQPHVGVLIDALSTYVLRTYSTQADKSDKSDMDVTEDKPDASRTRIDALELSVLARVAPYAHNEAQASQLLNLLVPQVGLHPRLVSIGSKISILRIAQAIITQYGHAEPHVDVVSSLLESAEASTMRLLACDVLQAAAEHDCPALLSVAPLLKQLNAMDGRSVGEVADYEVRLEAYTTLLDLVQADKLTVEQLRPVLRTLTFVLTRDDFTLRNSTVAVLEALVQQISPDDARYIEVIDRQLIRALKRGVRSKVEGARYDSLNLLALLTRTYSATPRFSTLQPLLSEDDDKDFFKNLVHMQRHRKIKGLQFLQTFVTELELDGQVAIAFEDTLTGFFLPVCGHFVYQNVKVQDSNLVATAIITIGQLSRHLRWPAYTKLLSSYLTQVTRRPQQEKTLLRVVVAVLDHFHFSAQQASTDGEMDEHAVAVHTAMTRVFLPKLQRLLTYKDSEEQVQVRSTVAMTIVKLLLNLPVETLHAELPGLILKLTSVLRHRHVSIRDEARAVVVDIAQLLGPKYVRLMVSELKDGLQRGYQRHVLAYTINGMLNAVQGACEPGDLDGCIENLMEVILDDLFGEAGEEKEADDKTNKTKEEKKRTSYNTAAILARLISPSVVNALLLPVKDAMATSERSSIVNKIQELIRSIGKGLELNSGLDTDARLRLCYSLVAEHLSLSKQGQVKVKDKQRRPESIFIVQPRPVRGSKPERCFNTNAHMLVMLGLQLLQSLFKLNQIDGNDAALLGMLDPFTPLLVDALFSKYNRVLSLAARIWSYYIVLHASLPSLRRTI
jgi:U3 small nucleolar RNA-associated protein 20